MLLKNKTAIITGGGRGIGKITALELAKEGCNIVLAARSACELNDAAHEIEAEGAQVLSMPLDLALEESVNRLVDMALVRFGSIDILINNAGVLIPKPLQEVTLEEFDSTMNLNLRSAFLLSMKALAVMKERGEGYIVNISSTVALGVPSHLATYGMSKCGIVGLSQALYQEARNFGVKVSTVYPGITDTKMVRDANDPTDAERWMMPEDIACCILFLLKSSSRMVVRDIVPEAFRL